MKHQTFVTAVLYVRGEADTMAEFMQDLGAFLAEKFSMSEIVVVVDDGSDKTSEMATRATKRLTVPVTVLTLARFHGIETGIMAGLDRAMGDFVFELEGTDIDFPLDLLEQMFVKGRSGYDIVAGVPDAVSRRSRLFYHLVNRYSNLGRDLQTEHVRLVSRRSLNAMLLLREKVRYRKALYVLTGYPYLAIRYRSDHPSARRANRETMGLAFDILISMSSFGLRLAHMLSIVFFSFSLLALGWAAFNFFFNASVVQGWTTIMVLLSGGFAGVFVVLGILGEYLGRLLVETRGRPIYVVRDDITRAPDIIGTEPASPR